VKKFLRKTALFSTIIIIPLIIFFIYLPDPVIQNSLLGSIIEKNAMLAKTESPKIILAGGSNVSFGFNSKKIIDAYKLPVVNTAITIDLGLKFIINDIKPYVRKGDIVILSTDYRYYYDDPIYFEGSESLVATVFDVFPEGRNYIDLKQWGYLLQWLPFYTSSKITTAMRELRGHKVKLDLNDVYGLKSFNQYGDAYIHWNKPNVKFKPEEKCTGNEILNPDIIPFLIEFNKYVSSKGATLVLIPPPLDAASFDDRYFIINKIDSSLRKNGLPFITNPIRYKFATKYFFNNPYHLNKAGADKRTELVIEDISKIIYIETSK